MWIFKRKAATRGKQKAGEHTLGQYPRTTTTQHPQGQNFRGALKFKRAGAACAGLAWLCCCALSPWQGTSGCTVSVKTHVAGREGFSPLCILEKKQRGWLFAAQQARWGIEDLLLATAGSFFSDPKHLAGLQT